ncbi:VOC family protein [Pseudochelatococcus sp. B33]
MTRLIPRIDHVLVNVNDRLDEAVRTYERLGFVLTPRGHHSLGSSNHLAVFGDDYLELVGYEPQNAEKAAGAWGDVTGLAGLAFRADDAGALDADLRARRIPLKDGAPLALSRPVELPDGTTRDARFGIVHLDPRAAESGRIFFCQHLDPDLVWRSEWQRHPNAATGVARLVIAARDPARSVGLLADIFGADRIEAIEGGQRFRAEGADIDYLRPDAVRAAFGDNLPAGTDTADRKIALVLRTASRATARQALERGGIGFTARPDGALLVPARLAAGAVLAFE